MSGGSGGGSGGVGHVVGNVVKGVGNVLEGVGKVTKRLVKNSLIPITGVQESSGGVYYYDSSGDTQDNAQANVSSSTQQQTGTDQYEPGEAGGSYANGSILTGGTSSPGQIFLGKRSLLGKR